MFFVHVKLAGLDLLGMGSTVKVAVFLLLLYNIAIHIYSATAQYYVCRTAYMLYKRIPASAIHLCPNVGVVYISGVWAITSVDWLSLTPVTYGTG